MMASNQGHGLKRAWQLCLNQMAFVTIMMALILSGSAWAKEIKSLSRQELDTMIRANTGKVTLVVYWTTWCSSCRQEFPALNELHAAYPQDSLRIIGVSLDKDGRQLQAFMQRVPCAYENYWVPPHHAEAFQDIQVLPTLVFYKKNGTKGWTNKGPMQLDQIRKTITIFVGQN